MLRRPQALIPCLLALAMVAATLTGCGPKGPVYADSGALYTKATLSSIFAKTDITPYAKQPAADVSKLRHDALTALGRRGGDASKAAALLTATFPAKTRGVPVYVEWVTLDGKRALVFVEAIGPINGELTTKRLWALSETGDVIFVATK